MKIKAQNGQGPSPWPTTRKLRRMSTNSILLRVAETTRMLSFSGHKKQITGRKAEDDVVVSGGDFSRAYASYNCARRSKCIPSLEKKLNQKSNHKDTQARRLKMQGVYERHPQSRPKIEQIMRALTKIVACLPQSIRKTPGAPPTGRV